MPSGVKAKQVKKVTGTIPEAQLTCRVWGHRWSEWGDLLHGRFPKTMEIERQPSGNYQLTEVCSRCGAKERELTLVGGVFDGDAVVRYRDVGTGSDAWVVVHRDPDLDVTRRDMKAEFFDRAMTTIKRRR